MSSRGVLVGRCNGRAITIPDYADTPPLFIRNKARLNLIKTLVKEEVEHELKLEEYSGQPAFSGMLETTIEVEDPPLRVKLDVIPDEGRTKVWGIHSNHRARNPKTSPFVIVEREQHTSTLTLVFNKLQLVRIIPGEYYPALPWMASASNEDGGKQACIDFWSTHSYVARNHNIKESVDHPPTWYC